MLIKGLIDEDFVNYKKPAMFISTCFCDWKCCKENNIPISECQNCELAENSNIEISIEKIFNRYISNPISQALVIGGLEPIMQKKEIYDLIKYFRDNGCNDDIVIYTGYEPYEISEFVHTISCDFDGVIMKFGRFIPNQESHYDNILGVNLCSDNQRGIQLC